MLNKEMQIRWSNGENPLLLSIEKWKDIRENKGVDNGRYNCALCHTYNREDEEKELNCIGCPVYRITGKKYCIETPYGQFDDHTRKCGECSPEYGEYCTVGREIADEMVCLLENIYSEIYGGDEDEIEEKRGEKGNSD